MSGPRRIGKGLLTDPARSLEFDFDGRRYLGLAGDTVASALLANGVRLTGRSFKYHRPRGIVGAGPEEPCALIDVLGTRGREPNRLATTTPLSTGLKVESQNRWPSLRFDFLSANGLLGRVFAAGFYYKTFMWPAKAWERLYEPLIRRAAGLGRLDAGVPGAPPPSETVHHHTDVLVVGAGAAGLAAAQRLADGDVRVLLVERDVIAGGGTLLDPRWQDWRNQVSGRLDRAERSRIMTRSTVIGGYGHGVFVALETLTPADSERHGGLRERLHVIRARRVLIATGASERLIACPGNDRPGVMLAGAALAYLRRYGVAVGERPVLFANSDLAYDSVLALAAAGLKPAAVVDPRPRSLAAERARAAGITVHDSAVISAIDGGRGVRGVHVTGADGRLLARVATDCVLLSGGYTPATELASQSGAALSWQDDIAAFVPRVSPAVGAAAGAARGVFGLAAAACDGVAAAESVARSLSVSLAPQSAQPSPPDADATPLRALWEVPGRGKAFVDLQHDVTADDVRLANQEGYQHVEHMKRYTTHGMATDQGRSGGLLGSAVLAAARGISVAEVGTPTPRPYLQPPSFAALAGAETGAHLRPRRLFPAHASHVEADASFIPSGWWLRPLVYSQAKGWEPVLREARAVRQSVGLCDASSLGKIDVQGRDAARFLDYIYANTFSSLAVGKARYGIMLREDGCILDDGTTSRLAPEHFLVTTTTANHSAVLDHMEFQLQANKAGWDVVLTDVTDQWAQFAVAGPRSRDVIAAVTSELDVSNTAFPFMAAASARLAGVPGRLFRISFSGELAYEVAVPARHADAVWTALLAAGKPHGIVPYGVDALNTLRIEKGHVTGAEMDGNATAHDLGFARMLKTGTDYVGRVLAQRPALTSPQRMQLVAVRPIDRGASLRTGGVLLATADARDGQGYVTSATPSVEVEGWVGLALLANGRQRLGENLLAASPMHSESVAVEVLSPHWLDPENARVRG